MPSRFSIFLLITVVSCQANDTGAPAPMQTTMQPSVNGAVAAARINERSETARVLELVDAEGDVVATYYPGFFNATIIVPDVDTGVPGPRQVAGTWFLGATFEGSTGRVGVAIRGFVYAETSFDLVYVIDAHAGGFGDDPYANRFHTYLPYDGRKNDGALPSAATGTRPWLDIIPEGISFDEASLLHLRTADASGAEADLAYGTDLRVHTCTWRYAESAARCPDPTR